MTCGTILLFVENVGGASASLVKIKGKAAFSGLKWF